jgi:hypothetical protein
VISAAGDDAAPVEHVVSLLRERLYGAISCLATLAVLARYTTEDTSAWARMLDVAVATGGLWAASLLADWVAHLGVYSTAPRGRELLRIMQSSAQILAGGVSVARDLGGLRICEVEDLHRYLDCDVAVGRRAQRDCAARRPQNPLGMVAPGSRRRTARRRRCARPRHQDPCALR